MPPRPSLIRLAHLIGALFAVAFSARGDTVFDERMRDAEKAVDAKRAEGKDAFYAELEKQARTLLKEFPDKNDPYEMLMFVATGGPAEKGRAILQELDGESVPPEVRSKARSALGKLERIGKPVEFKFKALDGRQVDLAEMKSKVVLVDFWATWSAPCIEEIPQLLEAYRKFHNRGFEIIGISLDEDKGALASLVKAKKMPWPEHFDGRGWKNLFAEKYAVTAIPEIWLVDKHGVLRDLSAQDGVVEKIEKLLAE